jgi:hypothetical protein
MVLHLLTDYVFYKFYFNKYELKKIPHDIFTANLYASYNYTNKWLSEKYNISYDCTSNGALMQSYIAKLQFSRPEIGKGINILTDLDKLTSFIEYVSGLDLEEIRNIQQIVF